MQFRENARGNRPYGTDSDTHPIRSVGGTHIYVSGAGMHTFRFAETMTNGVSLTLENIHLTDFGTTGDGAPSGSTAS